MPIFITILFFLIVQSLFDLYAPSQSLGWSIFYWVSFWSGLIHICINRIIHDASTFRKRSYGALIVPMFYKIGVVHLYAYFSGMTYIEWYYYAAHPKNELLFFLLIFGVGLFVIIRHWLRWRELKKTGP